MNIVFILDDSYAMSLSVAYLSLKIHLSPPCCIFIVDTGLSRDSEVILEEVLAGIQTEFIRRHDLSPSVAKLMLPSLLPELLKVLYLDADILIRSDIRLLWNLVQDTEVMAAAHDIGNSSATRPYFNAGVMFLNLGVMRKESLEKSLLGWARVQAGGTLDLSVFPWQDQDVLNHIFSGRWQAFPLTWNAQGVDSYAYFRLREGLLTEDYLQQLQTNADLVHFTGAPAVNLDQFNAHCPMPVKPWSGHFYSKQDSSRPLVYLKEWYALLHSIPAYEDWLPDLAAVELGLLRQVRETMTRLEGNLTSFEKSLQNIQPQLSEKRKVAVFLPITSRGSDVEDQLYRLTSLVASMPLTETNFYVAIDDNDIRYSSNGTDRQRLETCFSACEADYAISEFTPQDPVNLCFMVNAMAKVAYEDGCFYFLLLGDDVTMLTSSDNILEILHASFHKIKATLHHQVPFGFGCVLFEDESSIGFPSFPVVTRVHMEIFPSQWCPKQFINQDADPYLYEHYRPFKASIFNREMRLINGVGGTSCSPRYLRNHIEWKDEILNDGVKRINDYCLQKYGRKLSTCLRLDVIVPSFRINETFLERIINLPIPPHVETTFIVILDDPSDISHSVKERMENKYKDRVRVRVNEANKGASFSRNRGLDESSAQFVLFLDDDVIPETNLLYVVADEIYRTGHQYAGYVGATYLSPWSPSKMTAYSKAALLVHLLHFWVDNVLSDQEHAPWGITAQLVLRRTQLRFSELFPKTGGGEDIDMCIRTCRRLGKKLKNFPLAKCHHPWWDNGIIKSQRFRGWAVGDSLLVDLYPEYCYWSFPNGLELSIILSFVYFVCSLVKLYKLYVFDACQVYRYHASFIFLHASFIFLRDVAIILAVDAGDELLSIMSECNSYLPGVRGFERFSCGILGIFLYRIGGADYGHVVQPIIIRRKISHFFLRFDWWTGLLPNEIEKNRSRERKRFTLIITALALIHWLA